MSRSLKIRKKCVEPVKMAVKRNGFLSQRALADDAGLSLATVSNFLTGKLVDYATFVELCQRLALDCEEIAELDVAVRSQTTDEKAETRITNKRQDWGEAIDVSVFYGRTQELTTLEQWIVTDRCRLVALLGMGGIGKTALAVKLAQLVQHEFDYVIWRSLRNTPPLETLIRDLVSFISDQRETNAEIGRLIHYLRSSRCLLILDNTETILDPGHVGQFRSGYSGYSELLRVMGEVAHQSCLILTSRENVAEIAVNEAKELAVRSLRLSGSKEAALALLEIKGLVGSFAQKQELCFRYGNNPLALKIVATSIRDLFDGEIGKFLLQDTFVFNGIRRLLEQQLKRLSPLEESIMYWLAINREGTAIADLEEDIVPGVSRVKLLEALEGLWGRSLLEKQAMRYTQQPVVMEYVTERFIELCCEEIATEEVRLLMSHALIKATAKDYVRESQIRLILEPIIYRLNTTLKSKKNIEDKLARILVKLQKEFSAALGYGGGNIINLFSQSQINLTNYDFSHLTIWQADLRRVNLHLVNFQNADLTKSVFAETFGGVMSAAISPDGKLLVIGDTDGKISLLQVANGQKLLTFNEHIGWAYSVAFSPQGTILASGGMDRILRLWDVSTGQCLTSLRGHTSSIWSVAFSPQGTTLASGSTDKTVRLWDVSTGECLMTLRGHISQVWSVAFSPQGTILASGSEDQTIRLWDVSTGECLTTLRGHTDQVQSVAFSPLGTILASASVDQTVRLWDVSTGECLKTLLGHTKLLLSVAFSPDGHTLASAGDDHTVRLWNVSTGKCLKTLLVSTNRVWSVAFSPQGTTLASAGDDHTVKLWDSSDGKCLTTLRGYTNPIFSVAFSPDGCLVASAGDDHTVKLWDISNGEYLTTLQGHISWAWSVAFSPNGRLLASSSTDHTVKLWDVSTGRCLTTLLGHINWVLSVAFSPDGRLLASSSTDHTVKLWDVSTGECLTTLLGHISWVWSVAFSPDGRLLVSSSTDHTVKLWDISDGKCRKTLQSHTSSVLSIAFSPQGDIVASGSTDHTVKLWDINDGKCLMTLKGHTNRVWSVAFSPDGNTLASGSEDQTVRLWDISDGKCLITLQEHTNLVSSVTFSPDGLVLVSSSLDETIKLWNVNTGRCVRTLRAKQIYEKMNITGVTGLTEATIATLKALGAYEFQPICIP